MLLLILTLIGGGWDDRGKLLFQGILLSLAILMGGLIWSSAVDPNRSITEVALERGIAPVVQTESNPAKISLAKHLNNSGAVMYSAYWCPHCHDQKDMFGKQAVKELQVVECAVDGLNSQHSLCVSRKVLRGSLPGKSRVSLIQVLNHLKGWLS